MTTLTPTSSTSAPPTPALSRATQRLRATLWFLHLLVKIVALFSLITMRFDLWIDLRMLGPLGAFLLQYLWAFTAIPVTHCAGPMINPRKPVWINAGFSPRWAQRLLWPTYLLIPCLIANTVYFYRLVLAGQADFAFPAPLLVAMLLSAWVLLTREWLRRTLPPTSSAHHSTQFSTAFIGISASLFAVAIACIYLYARPLPRQQSADLAVVLGYGVLPDGTATEVLADRTRTAIDLYQRGIVKHILLSGAVDPPKVRGGPELNEVAAMRKVCLDAGLPESAITLDPVGINTRATAYNTRNFMREHHYQSVIVCTSNFHLFRSALSFRQVGLDPWAIPARPTAWICADLRDTLREFVGIAVYYFDPTYHLPKAATMNLQSPHLIVRKTAGALELFDGEQLIKSYACITGGNPGDKSVEGDRKTPVGNFRIVYKNPQSKFHLSLGLDYPNKDDAARGLAAGLITQQDYNGILEALASDLTLESNQKKLWYTKLGGEIFIHGFGTGRSATAGCVALPNDDIEELYALLPINTPVEIQP